MEVPAPDKGDTERRMIGAASSSSSNAGAPAAAAAAAEGGKEEGEGEEGPKVDETQLERLYRLNEAAYQALPEFEGPVTGLRGLELRPYQRQALAWMLRREGEGDGEEEGGEGAAARAGKRRRSGEGGVHLEMGPKEDEEDDEEGVVEVVGGGGGGKAGGGGSRTQVWIHQGLVQVAPATARRLARASSFHPLWDRRFLALPLGCGYHIKDAQGLGFPLPFYSNPYSKRLSLAVPPPPQPCKGGILGGLWVVVAHSVLCLSATCPPKDLPPTHRLLSLISSIKPTKNIAPQRTTWAWARPSPRSPSSSSPRPAPSAASRQAPAAPAAVAAAPPPPSPSVGSGPAAPRPRLRPAPTSPGLGRGARRWWWCRSRCCRSGTGRFRRSAPRRPSPCWCITDRTAPRTPTSFGARTWSSRPTGPSSRTMRRLWAPPRRACAAAAGG